MDFEDFESLMNPIMRSLTRKKTTSLRMAVLNVVENMIQARKYINTTIRHKISTSLIARSQLVVRATLKRIHQPRRRDATYAEGYIALRIILT